MEAETEQNNDHNECRVFCVAPQKRSQSYTQMPSYNPAILGVFSKMNAIRSGFQTWREMNH